MSTYLGGVTGDISVGVSIGIQSSLDELVDTVQNYINEGYTRVKLKIKPGYDIEPVKKN